MTQQINLSTQASLTSGASTSLDGDLSSASLTSTNGPLKIHNVPNVAADITIYNDATSVTTLYSVSSDGLTPYGNLLLASGGFELQSNSGSGSISVNTSGSIKTWDFNLDGSLTVPGDLIISGFYKSTPGSMAFIPGSDSNNAYNFEDAGNTINVVTIGTNSSHPSMKINDDGSGANVAAILELNSTTTGFLPPRMTTAQRETIIPRATGTATVVDYTQLAGSVLTVNGFALTEGTDWFNGAEAWITDAPPPLGDTYSLFLNGSYYAFANNTSLLDGLSDFSVSLWFKGSGAGVTIVSKMDFPSDFLFRSFYPGDGQMPNSPGWGLFHADESNTFAFVVQTDSNNNAYIEGGSQSGSWQNIIFTKDNTNTLTLYVDGVAVGSTATTGTLTSFANSIAVALGRTQGCNVDDVRMFSSVLSQADATAISGGGDPTGATEIARWQLEEGSGYTSADSVGSNTLLIGSNAQTAFSLSNSITGNTGSTLVTSISSSNVVTITANTPGPAGNSITLVTSDGTNLPVSGATLSGGGSTPLPEGLTIYNTDDHANNYWNGTTWIQY